MRESRTSGFVRGAHSNMCPYRDPYLLPAHETHVHETHEIVGSPESSETKLNTGLVGTQ
jgi:hypothetical protein